MTPESLNSSLLGNGSVNTAAEANANNRRAVFSMIRAALVAMQRCGKHLCSVNQHATTEEAVFSVGAAPRLYNEDLRHVRGRIEGASGDSSRRGWRREDIVLPVKCSNKAYKCAINQVINPKPVYNSRTHPYS
jgi:hypothetical protein